MINNLVAGRPSAISTATLKLPLSHTPTEIRNFSLLWMNSMILIISIIHYNSSLLANGEGIYSRRLTAIHQRS